MSAIKLNSSGGGSITISPASTASTLTLTAPAQTGTIGLDGPSFSAYASGAQSIATATWVKMQCNTEEWDTANCYDNATNYRFTPNVAGYYQVNGQVTFNATLSQVQCKIMKNGNDWKYGSNMTGNWVQVSCLVYLNGSTDYIEFYGAQVSGGTGTTSANTFLNYFQAALVRAA